MAMKGKDKFLRQLKALSDPKGPVNQALAIIADKIRADAFQSISAGSISGKNHVPSLPGEAPNRDGGVLQAYIVTETFPAELRAEVRAEAPYSAPLEFGTSKMEARPFLRPARDRNIEFARRVFEEKIADHVKKIVG